MLALRQDSIVSVHWVVTAGHCFGSIAFFYSQGILSVAILVNFYFLVIHVVFVFFLRWDLALNTFLLLTCCRCSVVLFATLITAHGLVSTKFDFSNSLLLVLLRRIWHLRSWLVLIRLARWEVLGPLVVSNLVALRNFFASTVRYIDICTGQSVVVITNVAVDLVWTG